MFDIWSRRHFGVVAGGAVASQLGISAGAKAKKTDKGRKRKGLCRRNGQQCARPGNSCKKSFCLTPPFTIEATWSVPAGHDAFLFVPPEDASTGPSPFIQYDCDAESHTCEDDYPFACASGDETSSGSEVITVFALLEGTYEYWSDIDNGSSAGDLTIVLRDDDGRYVQEWVSPANPTATHIGWHVFNVKGRYGSVTSIDELIEERVEVGGHFPNTNVCTT